MVAAWRVAIIETNNTAKFTIIKLIVNNNFIILNFTGLLVAQKNPICIQHCSEVGVGEFSYDTIIYFFQKMFTFLSI